MLVCVLVLGELLYPLLLLTRLCSFWFFNTDLGLSSSGILSFLGSIDALLEVLRFIDKVLAIVSGLGESSGAPAFMLIIIYSI